MSEARTKTPFRCRTETEPPDGLFRAQQVFPRRGVFFKPCFLCRDAIDEILVMTLVVQRSMASRAAVSGAWFCTCSHLTSSAIGFLPGWGSGSLPGPIRHIARCENRSSRSRQRITRYRLIAVAAGSQACGSLDIKGSKSLPVERMAPTTKNKAQRKKRQNVFHIAPLS